MIVKNTLGFERSRSDIISMENEKSHLSFAHIFIINLTRAKMQPRESILYLNFLNYVRGSLGKLFPELLATYLRALFV